MPRPTFFEFFCGGGMVRAGLGPSWACRFANDIDAKKARAYAENWGAESLRLADIYDLRPADLPGRAHTLAGRAARQRGYSCSCRLP